MDHVRVHYNSARPAQLNAHAYAQGGDIHVAPGQERHLPHEAWHVVQQAQGRVRPTMQMKQGVPVNDDAGLEREADAMGAKAMGVDALAHGPALAQPGNMGEVSQLVLATVNPQNGPVGLNQAGGGANFVIMENPTQQEGADVSNAVGFTGVLNAADWANLGKSPGDYWRAHGYANSFGGAGDASNVGWWKAASEEQWTACEQKVRGAGLAQIAAWLPGTGEVGTYLVERTMHPTVTLIPRYVGDLMKGVDWGMSDGRAAWIRAVASCDHIYPEKERGKRLSLLRDAKNHAVGAAQARVQTWVNALFGTSPLESNLIDGMKMTYTITTPGINAGASRAGFSQSIRSTRPNPIDFGLKNEPENIWTALVNRNQGLFAQGNPPAPLMVERVPYDDVRKPPQQLTARPDGWGAA